MRIIVLLFLFQFITLSLFAKSATDILNSNLNNQEKGLAIASEADIRDFGFGDFQVSLEMILRNRHGDTTIRKMRNKTLEIQDSSLGDKTLIIFDNPRDIKGTAFLTFTKILTPDDQWLYLPALERVKRISSKNKSGPFMGSEVAYEDIASFEVNKFTYNYLRNEACGSMQCFVLERFPQYEYSGYTRQIVWIDTEHFRVIKIDYYDRKNSLLKTQKFDNYRQYLGKYWRASRFDVVNHQTGKSTELLWHDYQFGVGLRDSDFTKDKLKRAR